MLIFIVFVFGFCFLTNAQDLSKLRLKLKSSRSDKERIIVINEIVKLTEDESSFELNQVRKKIAINNLAKTELNSQNKIFFKKALADSYFIEGIDYFNLSQLQKSKKCQEGALKLFKELELHLNEADVKYELAKIYTLEGNFKKAIDYFYKSLRLYENKKNFLGVADCYSGLAEIYSSQNQTSKALSLYKEAAKFYKSCNQIDGLCLTYCEISDCLITQGKLLEAKSYLTKAEKYRNDLTNYELALIELQKGVLADELLQADEAIMHYKNSLRLYELEGQEAFVCSINYLLGRIIFVQKKQAKNALQYVTTSLKNAENLNLNYDKERSNFLLYEIYKTLGNKNKSLQHLEKYVDLINKKNSSEIKNTLAQEQLKYYYEKKELLAKSKSEKESFYKNVWILSISFLVLLIGFVSFFSFRNTKQKKIIAEQKSNILKQKLLVTQMNPHFIFNSLNAIQNCIFKDDGLTAGTYLAQFADLMRMILDFSRKESISLDAEIKLLENYLQLQQFRFNNKFEYFIDIDKNLNSSQVQIPPMLAQPFIENAIEHGIFHSKTQGQIFIRIKRNSNNLRFEIEDNGIGLEESYKHKTKTHQSLAILITQERINDLFLSSKLNFDIEIHDLASESEDKSGVLVIFEIPFKFNKL